MFFDRVFFLVTSLKVFRSTPLFFFTNTFFMPLHLTIGTFSCWVSTYCLGDELKKKKTKSIFFNKCACKDFFFENSVIKVGYLTWKIVWFASSFSFHPSKSIFGFYVLRSWIPRLQYILYFLQKMIWIFENPGVKSDCYEKKLYFI